MIAALQERARAVTEGLPRIFWWLLAGTLVNKLGAFVVPFLTLYLTLERGFSPAEAGLALSFWGAGTLVSGPLGGVLADRVGRRTTMLLSLGLGGVGMISLGFARPLWLILGLTVFQGVVAEMYRPAVMAVVADVTLPQHRLRAYGYLYWAINAGFAVAAVTAGLLAHLGWLVLFVGDGLTTLGYAVIVAIKVPETRPAEAVGDREHPLRGLARVVADRDMLGFVVLGFFLALIFMQHAVTLPIDMSRHGLGTETFGGLIAINGVLIVLVQPVAVNALRRTRRGRQLAAAALLVGAGFGMNALVSEWRGYAAAIVVWTLGEIVMTPASQGIVADLAPAALRGRYQGLYGMAWGSAGFAAPFVGGLVMSHLGSTALWMGCAALGVAVAVAHLAIAPARRRRLASGSHSQLD